MNIICHTFIIAILQAEKINQHEQLIATLETKNNDITNKMSDFVRELQESKKANSQINSTMISMNSKYTEEFNKFKTEMKCTETGKISSDSTAN